MIVLVALVAKVLLKLWLLVFEMILVRRVCGPRNIEVRTLSFVADGTFDSGLW